MLSRMSPSVPFYLAALIVFVVIGLRYLLFAGGAFLFFHRNERWANDRRRLARPADKKQVKRELLASLSTVFVFTGLGLVIAHVRRAGLAPVAPEWLRSHPALWFVGSLAFMLFVHDFYFYWAHRLMHTRWLYERVHLVHHKSNNPSPLSAFAFHPSEAVLEALPIFVVLLTVPVTPWAIFAFQLLSLGINVYGHLGVELTPSWWLDRWTGKVFNTTTHHHLHHRSNKYNFGLYLNVWDRLFNTNHPEYAAKFRAVTERDALPERGALTVSHEETGPSDDGVSAA